MESVVKARRYGKAQTARQRGASARGPLAWGPGGAGPPAPSLPWKLPSPPSLRLFPLPPPRGMMPSVLCEPHSGGSLPLVSRPLLQAGVRGLHFTPVPFSTAVSQSGLLEAHLPKARQTRPLLVQTTVNPLPPPIRALLPGPPPLMAFPALLPVIPSSVLAQSCRPGQGLCPIPHCPSQGTSESMGLLSYLLKVSPSC